MTSQRRFVDPPVWDDDELERQRRQAVANFISERTTEGGARYRAAYTKNIEIVRQLFTASDDLLSFANGAALALNPGLIRAARYLGGPPISADDLDTLAESTIAKRTRLDADLASRAAGIIQSAMDEERFPS
jgi:hypothetical protein